MAQFIEGVLGQGLQLRLSIVAGRDAVEQGRLDEDANDGGLGHRRGGIP